MYPPLPPHHPLDATIPRPRDAPPAPPPLQQTAALPRPASLLPRAISQPAAPPHPLLAPAGNLQRAAAPPRPHSLARRRYGRGRGIVDRRLLLVLLRYPWRSCRPGRAQRRPRHRARRAELVGTMAVAGVAVIYPSAPSRLPVLDS